MTPEDIKAAIFRAVLAAPGDITGVALHPDDADDVLTQCGFRRHRPGDTLHVYGVPVTVRDDVKPGEVEVLRLPTPPRIEGSTAYFACGMTMAL